MRRRPWRSALVKGGSKSSSGGRCRVQGLGFRSLGFKGVARFSSNLENRQENTHVPSSEMQHEGCGLRHCFDRQPASTVQNNPNSFHFITASVWKQRSPLTRFRFKGPQARQDCPTFSPCSESSKRLSSAARPDTLQKTETSSQGQRNTR